MVFGPRRPVDSFRFILFAKVTVVQVWLSGHQFQYVRHRDVLLSSSCAHAMDAASCHPPHSMSLRCYVCVISCYDAFLLLRSTQMECYQIIQMKFSTCMCVLAMSVSPSNGLGPSVNLKSLQIVEKMFGLLELCQRTPRLDSPDCERLIRKITKDVSHQVVFLRGVSRFMKPTDVNDILTLIEGYGIPVTAEMLTVVQKASEEELRTRLVEGAPLKRPMRFALEHSIGAGTVHVSTSAAASASAVPILYRAAATVAASADPVSHSPAGSAGGAGTAPTSSIIVNFFKLSDEEACQSDSTKHIARLTGDPEARMQSNMIKSLLRMSFSEDQYRAAAQCMFGASVDACLGSPSSCAELVRLVTHTKGNEGIFSKYILANQTPENATLILTQMGRYPFETKGRNIGESVMGWEEGLTAPQLKKLGSKSLDFLVEKFGDAGGGIETALRR